MPEPVAEVPVGPVTPVALDAPAPAEGAEAPVTAPVAAPVAPVEPAPVEKKVEEPKKSVKKKKNGSSTTTKPKP